MNNISFQMHKCSNVDGISADTKEMEYDRSN